MIATKIRKQNIPSSKKKKLAKMSGERKNVNDIRNFFETANRFKDKSDLVLEKSDLDGSCGIKAKNNTTRAKPKNTSSYPHQHRTLDYLADVKSPGIPIIKR